MAKATNKEKGASARPRTTRASLDASLDADAAPIRARAQDEPREEDELTMASDERETFDDDLLDEDDDESLRLDPSSLRATGGEGGSVSVATRPSARGLTVPEPLMRTPITRFFAESYIELRKVTWPTRNEAWNLTLLVIAMSALVAVILGVADVALTHLLTWIVGLGGAGPAAAPAVPAAPPVLPTP
ncbi:MAG TPA: preprotein translocase subunit SecE [Ktedonobacterales bacterium]